MPVHVQQSDLHQESFDLSSSEEVSVNTLTDPTRSVKVTTNTDNIEFQVSNSQVAIIDASGNFNLKAPGSGVVFEDGTELGSSEAMVRHGWMDYNDLVTATTPLSIPATMVYTDLTNDGAGPFTNLVHAPPGVTSLWNTTTNSLDFSELSIGDSIDIRLDLTITTTEKNQEVATRVLLANGGSSYDIPLNDNIYKNEDEYHLVKYMGLYIGDINTRDNPAKLQIATDELLDVVVNGIYIRVLRGIV